ncbi:MAG TPA: D-glycero-beta-D-manno-heptose 1-phosphate adenylyltransferase [Bacteroidales bacterium]|jgi:rfaE bifunctional protein nucleotidyltransferase chain/domain|nr:D-glycero-beta-D-manno-heptose 1-phosphate adenylyltransferase [Bacteroidales bacterium]
MSFLQHIQNKIVTQPQAVDIVSQWKQQGETVVFTNGCFDIIHKGHVHYLALARDLGTKLIVGLNTDESVSALKGPNRPVKELESRALTLAAFACIDLIIPFAQETPYELITAIIPNILVKGSDYNENTIVGADVVKKHGGKVTTIDFVSGYSSTNYFKKM